MYITLLAWVIPILLSVLFGLLIVRELKIRRVEAAAVSSMTWIDSLKAVFGEFASADKVPPDNFLNLLREKGIVMHKSIEEGFNELVVKEKKDVIQALWNLAHQDKMLPEQQLELYDRVADRYKQSFEWEEEVNPGWMI